MDISIRKLQKILERHPSITSIDEDEVEELVGEGNLNAITAETKSTNVTQPYQFLFNSLVNYFPLLTQLTYLCLYSLVIVSKATAISDFFNLRFFESQNALDPQLEAVYQ